MEKEEKRWREQLKMNKKFIRLFEIIYKRLAELEKKTKK